MDTRIDRIGHALALGAALGLAGAALAEDRELAGSTPAKGLTTLRLDAHVGSVEVVVGEADEVRWTLRLVPDGDDGWFGGRKDAQATVDAAKVRAAAAGDAWQLAIELPRGADFDDVAEHWRVEVPARFAVVVDANVGEVAVVGPAGGIEVTLNVGELRIQAPRGDLRARVNVGEIDVRSATAAPGRVQLESNVGEVDLQIEGKRIESSGFFAVGGEVSSTGSGEDDIEARVNVGEVRVKVQR